MELYIKYFLLFQNKKLSPGETINILITLDYNHAPNIHCESDDCYIIDVSYIYSYL
jgi:hypothetical protein